MLPSLTRDQLLAALRHFDAELRDSAQWTGWEDNQAHRWAIEQHGRRYPIKQVVALAAGVGVHTFSGGDALNRRIARLGFTLIRLDGHAAPPPSDAEPDDHLPSRIAELELQVLTEQVCARLALAALAATAELARHAEDCPLNPCTCGYIRAEALAAEVVTFMADTAPTPAQLVAALGRLAEAGSNALDSSTRTRL